ncbi:hypothetical protein [Candidatus Protochlamydia phocaeensis]|uniref:hypothetical protein n=1 Tax=Candidatus Protochlamydia phocaeensis TaxID=1414722 RepID=UPI000839914D|nr:hypothetical protein [Candidatus Protochlamydia phocaeensis]
MLKLEKSSPHDSIDVCLREREGLFNLLFVKALALALLVHVGAFLLFHIQPFKLISTFVFPPVHVQMEPSPLLSAPLLLQQTNEEAFDFSPPPLLLPRDPLLSSFPSQQALDLPNAPPSSFAALEQHYWPSLMSPPPVVKKPVMRLFVSGDLAAHSLLYQSPLLKKEIETPPLLPLYATYQVRVEKEQGTIFWYDRLQSSGDPAFDRLAEHVLLDLQFETDFTAPILTGMLHFIF